MHRSRIYRENSRCSYRKKCDPNTVPSGSEYEPYYVHDYIAQFAMAVNTKSDFGGAYNNRESGFHYFISPSDSFRASKTFAHEFGHGLLGLGDEYSNGFLLEDKELMENIGACT